MFAHVESVAVLGLLIYLVAITAGFVTAAFLLRKKRGKSGARILIVGIFVGSAIAAAWYVLLAMPELLGF